MYYRFASVFYRFSIYLCCYTKRPHRFCTAGSVGHIQLRAAWLASRLARRSINVSQLEDILSARQTRQASRQRGSWVMVSGYMWVWMILRSLLLS